MVRLMGWNWFDKEFSVHFVTKILVVAAAVLAILLAALTIAYSSNADRIAGSYHDMEAEVAATKGSMAAQAAIHGTQEANSQAKIAALNNQMTQLQSNLNSLLAENSKLTVDKNAAVTESKLLLSKFNELQTTASTQASLIQSYRDETTTLRKNELAFNRQSVEMNDRISDLDAKRDVLEQSVRALQEQLAEARTSMEKAQSGASAIASGNAVESFVSAGPLVSGRIDELSKDSLTGATMVKINVGSNDSVKDNMKFFVVRDGKFIGTITVVRTDLKFAVGKVSLLADKSAVQTADMVLSRIN